MNLQKFTLSTLTFLLVTALAVGGFSESASAKKKKGGSWGTSPNIPALNFDVFLENEDGTSITDDFEKDDNLGVFKNAIEIINDGEQILTNVSKPTLEENSDADVAGFDNFEDGSRTSASFRAELAELDGKKLITYEIFDDKKPDEQFLKFAPVDVSSRSEEDIIALVNDLQSILDDGKEGKYDVTGVNTFKPEEVGVLGKAIGLSLRFQEEDKDNEGDFIEIKKFDTTTKVPEPSTILASLFAFGFGGKFLGKYRKNKA